MTDSSHDKRRRRRSGPNRVPPTIDLTATEVAEAASHEAVDPLSPGTATPTAEAGAADADAAAQGPAGPAAEETGMAPAAEPAPPTAEMGSPTADEARPAAPDWAAAEIPGSTADESRLAAPDASPAADVPPSPDPLAADEPGREPLHAATAGPAAAHDRAIPGSRDAGPRRPGFGSLAAAGLLGGLVGAGLVYGLQTWRSTAPQADPRLAQVEQQLGGLARQDAVRGLEGRLGALETAQTGLAQRVQGAQSLAERAAARAEEAINRPAPPAPAVPAAPQDNAAVGDLANRLGALEAQLGERLQAAAGATQALERRLTEQDQKLAAAAQPLERRLADQEQRLAALARQVAEGGSDATRAGTRVVLADRLGNALREGAPYADVLAGLRRLTPDAGRLAALEPFAQSGAPSAAALAQSFRPVSERLQRDLRPGDEDWTDRLLRMADKIVTVRSVNDPDGTGVPATLARIEEALNRGALGDAAAAWDSLPEAARQASAEWGQRLKQRAEAEAGARAVAADAVAALNQATR